ncbi:saccharopine dehydrogenase [Thiobaca trueperi]|uniref:Saccharopine dehydrogenase-like NADP-dependent oxidoreductase n=1 Tax=Thiobaca trueperi TaxID=127458 RepID=A0A4R3N4U6_9GAMM|nr:saccharopine dehydrogenase [Thiobaca trueperi]TCT24190.1 saccharopine dehydrogenase-like NADP-dependent oxidoreductase [Thiobaca trueperi]
MPDASLSGSQPPPATIVFFGLGAVGSSLLICLSELAERDGVPIRFLVYTIDPSSARDALFHAEPLLEHIDLVGVTDFAPIFALEPPYDSQLAGAALLVNAALPSFNCPIIELALRVGAQTLDLASDMYDAETARTRTFAQYRFDKRLRKRGLAALINMGISPGITNFLIGKRVHDLLSAGRRELEIERIDLYLLEDIDADAVIFSWSPVVALEELSQHPLRLEQGRMETLQPFTGARDYTFPHEPKPTRQYPLYQEELLSLHRSFPEIESIGVYTGGSEVELVKALHQLNLLSKRALPDQPGLTVEAVVRAVLPGMKKPRRIEDYLRSGVIRRTHFCAAAEIRVSEAVRNERQTLIETVGLSYLRYRGLLDTPYAGATYISYPTAVGAAILAWHTLEHARSDPGAIRGVVTGEDLAALLPRARIDAVRRDLVAWDIDLFESVRDAASA